MDAVYQSRKSDGADHCVPVTHTDLRRNELTGIRLRFGSLVVPCLIFLAAGLWAFRGANETTGLGIYVTFVWTVPTLVSIHGIRGAIFASRELKSARQRLMLRPPAAPVSNTLIVSVPTLARIDSLPAVKRVISSCITHFQPVFPNFRIDIIAEEDAAGIEALSQLARHNPQLTILIVPAEYRTASGARFKARANQYATEQRDQTNSDLSGMWILHMDDDTSVGRDTAHEIARFIETQDRSAPNDRKLLAQGVLAYPRDLAASWIVWMADSVRPGCDLSLFARSTGGGSPSRGLHGELLLVAANVESSIGWDFGPRSIVEDAEFALRFAAQHPGRSSWLTACCYGASPVSIGDFLRQRERWVWGLLGLITSRSVRFRHKLLMTHNVLVWALAPFQHPIFILAVAVALQGFETSPATILVIPLWSLNFGFGFWLYWQGLTVNRTISGKGNRLSAEHVSLILLIPLLSLMEVGGILRGIWRYVSRQPASFEVVAKPK